MTYCYPSRELPAMLCFPCDWHLSRARVASRFAFEFQNTARLLRLDQWLSTDVPRVPNTHVHPSHTREVSCSHKNSRM